MHYTKAQRQQAKLEKRFSSLQTYPKEAVEKINSDDYIMLPALVKAFAELHIHFNGGRVNELWNGTDS